MRIIKRVIYHPKTSLFVISNKHHMPEPYRVRTAPPVLCDTTEIASLVLESVPEKGLTLEKDGFVLTQELLDDFVDSSEEETLKEEDIKRIVVPDPNVTSINETKDTIYKETLNIAVEESKNISVEETKNISVEETKNISVEEFKIEAIKIDEKVEEIMVEEIKIKEKIDQPKAYTIPESIIKTYAEPPKLTTPTITAPKAQYKKHEYNVSSRVKLIESRPMYNYSLNTLLSIENRKSVPLNYDRTLFKKSEPSEIIKLESVIYDTVSLFRREMNRVAKTNLNSVMRIILKFEVNSAKEMEEMSSIFFEKAITESNYMELYVTMLRTLKNQFICKEDSVKVGNPEHTIFWTYLCRKCKETLESKENWSYELENAMKNLSLEERFKYEVELEEKETVKIKKKQRIVGTVKLISALFLEKYISDIFIVKCMNTLISDISNKENVEIIVIFLSDCGARLNAHKPELVKDVIDKLKEQYELQEKRVKFMILDLIEIQMPNWKESKKKLTSPYATVNRFSLLTEINPQKVKEENVDEIIQEIRNMLIAYVKEYSNSSFSINETEANKYLLERIKKCKASDFLTSYFYNTCEILEYPHEMSFYFSQISPLFAQDIICEALTETFALLDELQYDSPFCFYNFVVLSCLLKSDSVITNKCFLNVQLEDKSYEKKLFLEWKSQNKEIRIKKVWDENMIMEMEK